jgi:probable HAF family extracellular repeat protein
LAATAINNRGEVAGDSGGHGFVYDHGTFTTLDGPGASVTTSAVAINDRGEVAGYYRDGSALHGFVYDDGTFTTLDAPGAANWSEATAINNRGEVAGHYQDSSGTHHGFVYDDGTFTTLDAPGSTSTWAYAINDGGEVAGQYQDSNLVSHGFVYDHGTFTTLDVPSGRYTKASAINDRGEVAGFYNDSSDFGLPHGFLATPSDGHGATSATLSDLLSNQAIQVSMSDLLPGASVISGGSPKSASASGMMDQTPSIGASFASFDVGSVQAATTMPLNNG